MSNRERCHQISVALMITLLIFVEYELEKMNPGLFPHSFHPIEIEAKTILFGSVVLTIINCAVFVMITSKVWQKCWRCISHIYRTCFGGNVLSEEKIKNKQKESEHQIVWLLIIVFYDIYGWMEGRKTGVSWDGQFCQ